MRLMLIVKAPYIFQNPTDTQPRNPFFIPLVPVNSKHPAKAIFVRALLILGVYALIDVAQVVKPIIRSNAVSMVNIIDRVISGNCKPRKPVSEICLVVYLNRDISPVRKVPRLLTAENPLSNPSKNARILIVRKETIQFRLT